MSNSYEIKQPANISELYRKSRFILLAHKIDVNFHLYGNPFSQEIIEISHWGSFIIRNKDRTFRVEIPKYAPFNHT